MGEKAAWLQLIILLLHTSANMGFCTPRRTIMDSTKKKNYIKAPACANAGGHRHARGTCVHMSPAPGAQSPVDPTTV
jgi:hypothetical protein